MLTGAFQNESWMGPVLLVLFAALCGVCGYLFVQLKAVKTRWSQLLDGRRGEDIERLLYDHLRQRMELEEQVTRHSQRISELESKMLRSKRFVGVVRYDAFEDVGGSQSFALAVYDDMGNGAIVTSLVGRADCRVYCKPLLGGKSDRSLSQEEIQAMQRAKDEAAATTSG